MYAFVRKSTHLKALTTISNRRRTTSGSVLTADVSPHVPSSSPAPQAGEAKENKIAVARMERLIPHSRLGR